MERCAVMADLDRYEERLLTYAKNLKLEEADGYGVLWDIIDSAGDFLHEIELKLEDNEDSTKLDYYEDKGLSIFNDLYKMQDDLKAFIKKYKDFIE